MLPNVKAASKKNEGSQKEEWAALTVTLLRAMRGAGNVKEVLQKLAETRLEQAWERALEGFDIDYETARQLLTELDIEKLSQKERQQRDRLVAALNNLIDFTACEEYQLYKEFEDLEDTEEQRWREDEEESLAPYLSKCNKYNEMYAEIEDADISYAMSVASVWIGIDDSETLTYMTQNDYRVRPWHMALQGFTAKKREFPDWMIPPIEWACRCYLLTSTNEEIHGTADVKTIMAKATDAPTPPKEINGIFKESVCNCGRIFSDEHPYFEVEEMDIPMLNDIVAELRKKHYGKVN